MLAEIVSACEAKGVRPVGVTIETICEKVLAQPVAEPEFDPAGGRVIFDSDDRPC
jgi:hypothetical protein